MFRGAICCALLLVFTGSLAAQGPSCEQFREWSADHRVLYISGFANGYEIALAMIGRVGTAIMEGEPLPAPYILGHPGDKTTVGETLVWVEATFGETFRRAGSSTYGEIAREVHRVCAREDIDFVIMAFQHALAELAGTTDGDESPQ